MRPFCLMPFGARSDCDLKNRCVSCDGVEWSRRLGVRCAFDPSVGLRDRPEGVTLQPELVVTREWLRVLLLCSISRR